MPNTAAPHLLPYPAGGDAPNMNLHMQNLAESVHARLLVADADRVALGDRATALEAVKTVYTLADSIADAGPSNSAAEVDLMSYAMAAGLLTGAGGGVRLTAFGDAINNAGAARTMTMRAKLGATTIFATDAISIATNANRFPRSAELLLLRGASATAQRAFLRIALGLGSAVVGTAMNSTWTSRMGYGTAAEDLAAAKTLSLTGQWSLAAATTDMITRGWKLERVRAA